MLTPRNFISLTIVIAVFSILFMCWSMLQPPDSGGLRSDSYGTRGIGHRAIFETFHRLQVPVRRSLTPPDPDTLSDSQFVLWNPRLELVKADPTWLRMVAEWLQNGGQAVVAFEGDAAKNREFFAGHPGDSDSGADEATDPGEDSSSGSDQESSQPEHSRIDDPLATPTLFGLLGVGRLDIVQASFADGTENSLRPDNRVESEPFPADGSFVDGIRDAFTASSAVSEPRRYAVEAAGVFADSIPSGMEIELPEDSLFAIDISRRELSDTLHVVTAAGARHCIAARVPVGQGQVTVVSVRHLISNQHLESADNIVVAAGLLLAGGREIVFDEFYHGATIRGNPMWLFSRRTYGTVAVSLLLLLGVWVWRAAVYLGPPIEESPVQRRSITEYLDAMSRFLRAGRGHQKWSLIRVRDGILWKLRREFRLPAESHDISQLTALMSRKDPQRADRFITVLKDVSTALTASGSVGERSTSELVQRMTECLSKTDTTRSVPKLQK